MEFIENLELVAPLNPRDAFAGGRTEAFTLYKEASSNEEIDYVDFTALYLYINKYGKYPIRHPTRIFKDFDNINNYEDLINCKVPSRRRQLLLLLSCNINGKLSALLQMRRIYAYTIRTSIYQRIHNNGDTEGIRTEL